MSVMLHQWNERCNKCVVVQWRLFQRIVLNPSCLSRRTVYCFKSVRNVLKLLWSISGNVIRGGGQILVQMALFSVWENHKRFSLRNEVLHHWWTFELYVETVEEMFAYGNIKFGLTLTYPCVNVLLWVLGFSQSCDQGFWGFWDVILCEWIVDLESMKVRAMCPFEKLIWLNTVMHCHVP
jgi:hypothetical protein